VLGTQHVSSGAMSGLAVANAAELAGWHQPLPVWLVATGLVAGCAALPDIDHEQSTVARAFGPASRLLADLVNSASDLIYDSTRTPLDEHRDGGHRGITHTGVFALALGGAVAVGAELGGKWFVLGALWVCLSLALRGLLPDWSKHNGKARGRSRQAAKLHSWVGTALAAAALTLLAYWTLPDAAAGAWLGACVALGCLVHCLGDAPTEAGCPIFWPFVIRGQRWFPAGPPEFLRFPAGGGVELYAIAPTMTAVCGVLAAGLVAGWPMLGHLVVSALAAIT